MAGLSDERINEIIKHIIKEETNEDDIVDIITTLVQSKQQAIYIYHNAEVPLYKDKFWYNTTEPVNVNGTEILSK